MYMMLVSACGSSATHFLTLTCVEKNLVEALVKNGASYSPILSKKRSLFMTFVLPVTDEASQPFTGISEANI